MKYSGNFFGENRWTKINLCNQSINKIDSNEDFIVEAELIIKKIKRKKIMYSEQVKFMLRVQQ